MSDYTTTTDGITAQVYRDNGDKWQARIEADSTEVLRRLVRMLESHDAMANAADGLYDTVQDLRHVINGVLLDDDSGPVLDDVMSRGRKHIKAYRAALALVKGEQ